MSTLAPSRRRTVAKTAGDADEAVARRLADDLQEALRQLAASAKGEAAARAIGAGNADAFVGALDWDKFTFVADPMQTTTGGAALVHSLAASGPVDPITATLLFDLVETRAVNFAAQRAGVLIKEVSEQVRTTVRGYITEAVDGRFTTRQTAARIERIIPLHSRSAQAVDKTWTRTFESAIRDGQSESAARILADRVSERQAVALTRARSVAIARTEVMTAANTGRFEGWSASIASGIDSAESMKEWITGGNPCPECDPLDGEVVRWDEDFSVGEQMPPLHVNCRCTATLLPPSVSARPGEGRGNTSRDDFGSASAPARDTSLTDPMFKAKGTRSSDGRYLFPDVAQADAERIIASARNLALGRTSAAEHAALRSAVLGTPPEWSTS